MFDPMDDAGLLRFITCGSVDDGKSTLIGRLLLDTRSLLADALDTLRAASRRRGLEDLDLALVTDGLQAEREQGITIDVAYRAFATTRRRFILGDAPGHEQYTRNMVTAASTADLAVILVDATRGVLPQTRRHAALAHLLGVGRLVAAVNKMDLAAWSRETFEGIRRDFEAVAARLGIPPPAFIPVSALLGDGIARRSARMPWYEGPTLLEVLEAAPASGGAADLPFRLPVQRVCRPRPGAPRERGLEGRVASGSVRVGDPVAVLPSGAAARVRALRLGDASLAEARAGMSVTVLLQEDLDVSRGDLLADPASPPPVRRELGATLCWLGERPAPLGGRYLLRHGPREVRCALRAIRGRLDIATLDRAPAAHLAMNDIADVDLALQGPVAPDPYARNRGNGAFILIDEATNGTVAAGMVIRPGPP